MDNTGVVFNIQRYTVHDGPGIRTEVFLKGCPLRCKWCSNPESFSIKAQVGVYDSRCLGIEKCGYCLKACKHDALIIEGERIIGINRELCTDCLECEKQCPSEALKLWGNEKSVDEVMKVVEADRSYYEKSGGGITLSGGESLMQWKFSKQILERCVETNINTCVESALYVKSEILDEILPLTDIFITDIKHMDSDIHKNYTGVGNELIHENIKKVVEANIPIVIRIPIIPGINDTLEHTNEVGTFILEELDNRVNQVQFLRFRRLGEEKYKSMGLEYQMSDVDWERSNFEEHIMTLVNHMKKMGINAEAGTNNKIKL